MFLQKLQKCLIHKLGGIVPDEYEISTGEHFKIEPEQRNVCKIRANASFEYVKDLRIVKEHIANEIAMQLLDNELIEFIEYADNANRNILSGTLDVLAKS